MNTERKLGPGDDKEMILSDDQWPCWPILPVKNHTKICPLTKEKPMTGVICSGRRTVVFIGVLGLTHWATAKSMTYASVEALLADGWIID